MSSGLNILGGNPGGGREILLLTRSTQYGVHTRPPRLCTLITQGKFGNLGHPPLIPKIRIHFWLFLVGACVSVCLCVFVFAVSNGVSAF